MTQVSRPWQGTTTGDCGSYSHLQWHSTWKHMIGFGAESADVGVIRGVLNNLNVYGDSDEFIRVQSGAALVQGIWYLNDAEVSFVISDNLSAFNRYDTVVLEALYTGTQTVRLKVIEGTPAASPTRPALTQNAGVQWQIPLADFLVPPGSPPSVPNSDVSNRQRWANIPDRTQIKVTNASGAIRVMGDVMIWYTSSNQSVTTTTTAANTLIAGVVESYTGVGGTCRIVTQGLCYVRITGSVSRGNYLTTSTSDGLAKADNGDRIGVFGIALTSDADGYVLAYVNVAWPLPFVQNLTTDNVNNVNTTGAFPQAITGLSIAFTKQFTNTAVRFVMSGYANQSASATATLAIYDSTAAVYRGNSALSSGPAAGVYNFPFCIYATVTGIASGARTIIGRFGTTAGTLTVYETYLYVEEIFVS